jgi:hypothetical protein
MLKKLAGNQSGKVMTIDQIKQGIIDETSDQWREERTTELLKEVNGLGECHKLIHSFLAHHHVKVHLLNRGQSISVSPFPNEQDFYYVIKGVLEVTMSNQFATLPHSSGPTSLESRVVLLE